MSNAQTVTVSILGKEYQVSCQPEEVSALKESASYLDEKMREIKSGASVLGLDRIAVMAALNIANDFISQTRKTENVVETQSLELRSLSDKVDQALGRLRAS